MTNRYCRSVTSQNFDRLTGKVAVVTGAASGIGLSIAEKFLAEGACVVAGDVDVTGLTSMSTLASDRFLMTAVCDVTTETDVENLFAVAQSHFGGVDVVVANAGAGTYGLLADHTLEEWSRIIDLCLTGVFITVKHASKTMRDGGSLLTIASLNAIQPSKGMAAYCAAKAGVAMLTRVAAMELGERGIRANTIAPGLVRTNATSGLFSVPGVVDEFVENAPLSRYAEPSEIAELATFLASDQSSFMSASFLSIDGGGNTGRYPDLPRIFQALDE